MAQWQVSASGGIDQRVEADGHRFDESSRLIEFFQGEEVVYAVSEHVFHSALKISPVPDAPNGDD